MANKAYKPTHSDRIKRSEQQIKKLNKRIQKLEKLIGS